MTVFHNFQPHYFAAAFHLGAVAGACEDMEEDSQPVVYEVALVRDFRSNPGAVAVVVACNIVIVVVHSIVVVVDAASNHWDILVEEVHRGSCRDCHWKEAYDFPVLDNTCWIADAVAAKTNLDPPWTENLLLFQRRLQSCVRLAWDHGYWFDVVVVVVEALMGQSQMEEPLLAPRNPPRFLLVKRFRFPLCNLAFIFEWTGTFQCSFVGKKHVYDNNVRPFRTRVCRDENKTIIALFDSKNANGYSKNSIVANAR